MAPTMLRVLRSFSKASCISSINCSKDFIEETSAGSDGDDDGDDDGDAEGHRDGTYVDLAIDDVDSCDGTIGIVDGGNEGDDEGDDVMDGEVVVAVVVTEVAVSSDSKSSTISGKGSSKVIHLSIPIVLIVVEGLELID